MHEARARADGLALDRLAPPALPRAPRRARWARASSCGALGFGPVPGAAGRFVRPAAASAAAAATLIQVTVEPGDVTVPPGATLEARAQVEGTTRRPTLVFAREGARDERVAMDKVEDRWVAAVRGIAAPGNYWVEVSGVKSPLVRRSRSRARRASSRST